MKYGLVYICKDNGELMVLTQDKHSMLYWVTKETKFTKKQMSIFGDLVDIAIISEQYEFLGWL